MRSRVIPGSSPTIERRLFVNRLNSVDLPTLGRPTMATSGSASAPGRVGITDLRYVGKAFSRQGQLFQSTVRQTSPTQSATSLAGLCRRALSSQNVRRPRRTRPTGPMMERAPADGLLRNLNPRPAHPPRVLLPRRHPGAARLCPTNTVPASSKWPKPSSAPSPSAAISSSKPAPAPARPWPTCCRPCAPASASSSPPAPRPCRISSTSATFPSSNPCSATCASAT